MADEQAATIRFPRELHEQLRQLAFDSRQSMNSIVVSGARREAERRLRKAERQREGIELLRETLGSITMAEARQVLADHADRTSAGERRSEAQRKENTR
jgi:hypothetical protein